MHGEKSLSASNEIVAGLIARLDRAVDERGWRQAFCDGFDRLYAEHDLHPDDATPASTFETAARAARAVARECLPLGLGLVMHLYPYCALKCVPLPWWSPGSHKRGRLLRDIQDGGLILANAGSERVLGAHSPVRLTRAHEGMLVNGTYDYVSLAHVADLVLFQVDDGQSVFCAAETGDASVRIGPSRFDGSMQLSDTCAMSFEHHFVPNHRLIVIPAASTLHCMTQYQRSWFHLLLAEAYLARIERLQQRWDLARSTEWLASRNELAFLRKYSLCLLDDASSPGAIASVSRISAAVKLRTSLMAQATAAALREFDAASAHELGFIRRQPTCDERILQGLEDSVLETDERQKLAS
jgi:alkylation response protein AidB-like acyl-CoA dehydrogenase